VCSNFWEIKKIRKLRRNRGGPAFLVPCRGVQRVVENPFPATPLGFFPGNMAAVSDEHGERLHQDKYRMEKKIQWQMEHKYVGCLLLDACTVDTNRRIQDDKTTF